MTRSGEPKFSYSRISQDALVRTALRDILTLEGLLYFCEVRTWVGKLEGVPAEGKGDQIDNVPRYVVHYKGSYAATS